MWFHKYGNTVFPVILECAIAGGARRSKLRQTKAVASYRTPSARLWNAQAWLRLVSRQLAAAPTQSPIPAAGAPQYCYRNCETLYQVIPAVRQENYVS
jgi:hypothetical protein